MGFLIQGLGQIEAGQAQANASHYNAQVAFNNAAYASASGSAQAEAESLKNAQVGGLIKASQAANNIDVNSGSAVKVQQSQREAGNVDTATVENNALLTAYGYKQQGILQNQEAAQATLGAGLQAGGTFAEGATQFVGGAALGGGFGGGGGGGLSDADFQAALAGG